MFIRKGRKYLTLSPATQRSIWLILRVLNSEAGKAVARAEATARRWKNEPAAKNQRDHWRRHQASIRQIASRLGARWSKKEMEEWSSHYQITLDIGEDHECASSRETMGGGDSPGGSGSGEVGDSEIDKAESRGSGSECPELRGAGRDCKKSTKGRKPRRSTQSEPSECTPADR